MQPKDLGLPDKFTAWWGQQFEAARKVLASKEKVFLLEAPTGAGKTLIGAAIQRVLSEPSVYVCTTKSLQDQVLADFPYARVLKGKSNYPCSKFRSKFPLLNASHCTSSQSNPCDLQCPYRAAKAAALSSPMAVLNTSYLLAEANYAGGFTDIPFLILDEVDTLEDELMGFVELMITQKQLARLSLDAPKFKTKFESWVEWARPALKQVSIQVDQLEQAIDSDWGTVDPVALRQLRELEGLKSKLGFFIKEVGENWVWYPEEDKWTFKPVLVAKYAPGVLWRHVRKTLGMSATILDHHQMARNIGVGDLVDSMVMESSFPPERRPVYYEPVGDMGRKSIDDTLPLIASKVKQILDQHRGAKGLIHTVSYKVANYLMRSSNGRLITHFTQNRAQILEGFKKDSSPLVLVSPSMERGVDLPYDACEFIIICKTPYPYLGDPQVSKRLYGFKDGRRWYLHKTVSAIVQMTGRGMRAADDYCESYILDASFERLMSENRGLFPNWWKAALKG